MKALVSIAAITLLGFSSMARGEPLQCQAKMRKALGEGHFSGELICSRTNVTLVLAGQTSGNRFSIYNYRYRFLPHPGGVMHGGQRMLVFQHHRYIGQYVLTSGYYTSVAVKGTHVILNTKERHERVVLDFSSTPPKEIFVNGESETFGR